MLLTIIAFIVVLSILVFAHEMGHFLTARKLGIRAEEFGFGFPPRIGGVYKDKQGKWRFVFGNKKLENLEIPKTLYSFNWLPLGGFVKIKGEEGEGKTNEPDSLLSRSVGQRVAVMSAGVMMNIALAVVLISIGFMFGLPQNLDNISPKAEIKNRQIQIMEVLPSSPASGAKLKAGDFILTINGIKFNTYQELQDFVGQRVGEELSYAIKRGQENIIVKITPKVMPETKKGGIGILIAETGLVKYPWYLAIWEGIKTTFLLLWLILAAFYQLFKNLILGNGLGAEIGGPVRIAQVTGDVARMGLPYLINFTALLSINLAIINFLPFPALDGGRVLFLIIEKIKGRPVKRELEGTIHYIGFLLLLVLVLAVTFNDFSRAGLNFKSLLSKFFK